jgi:hypothetical protein
MSRWVPGESGNVLGAALRRPKRGTPLARAVVRLTGIKLERLAIDTGRDSPTVAQAKQLHLRAAKGDLRAIAMIQELSVTVTGGDEMSVGGETLTIAGREGSGDLISTIRAIYGLRDTSERERPLLPEASDSGDTAVTQGRENE